MHEKTKELLTAYNKQANSRKQATAFQEGLERDQSDTAPCFSSPDRVGTAESRTPHFNNRSSTATIDSFQKSYGNLSTLRQYNYPIQAKLNISQPNDPSEQEADRVADEIMRMPEAEIRSDNNPSATRNSLAAIQRRPICQLNNASSCKEDEVQEELSMNKNLSKQITPSIQCKESELHASVINDNSSGVTPQVESRIQSLQGGGQPLPKSIKSYFEPRFGRDFSSVRVHTDSQAAEMAQVVNAKAFTCGRDVVFAEQHLPESPEGQKLLAHELVHVVQQDQDLIQREPEPVNKSPAQRELLEWHRMALNFVNGNRAWLSANWTAYLSRTSQNPRLGWTEGTAGSVLSNAIGNLLTEVGEKLIKDAGKRSASTAGAAIGTAIEPGLGTVIGFVIGVLVESAASMIFEAVTGKTEADEAANAASRRAGDLILARTGALETQGAAALGSLEAVYGEAQTNLTNTTDQVTADRVHDWAAAEKHVTATPAPLSDRSLYDRMLTDWVLEHAGDEEDAAADTSEAQWEAARDERFGAGDLDRHPEIFAYQTRGEWSKAGLPTNQAEAIISRMQDLRRDAADPAATVLGSFDGRSYSFDAATDPEKLITYINKNNTLSSLSAGGKTAIRNNRFVLSCALDLTTADGSCYVDEWEYKIRATNPDDIEWYSFSEGSFDVSPD